jgi:hypothetical protein
MAPTYSEEEHYRAQAVYFASAAILLGCIASVHLEDSDDEVFWKPMLVKYSGGEKFNFLYYSQSIGGNRTTGVNQCLKYKAYLSKQFFICIDSDYRYLLQEPAIITNPFILQTYTYSFENHLCYWSELNKVCEKATGLENSVFDLERFLLAYSQTVYEVFIWHLYFVKNDKPKFLKSEFIELINLKEFADINDNGKTVIETLKQRCDAVVTKLKTENPIVNVEAEISYYKSLGIQPDNVYLFVRGHNLYDLICSIGTAINERILSQEKERLRGNNQAITELYKKRKSFDKSILKHIMFDAYPEIQRIGVEIKDFFK